MCLAQDTGLYLCCQFHAQFHFVLARFKFHFFVLWLSILLKFIWYGHHHPRHVLVASYRPPFVLIRPYIRIRATLLRIAASAKLPHVILRLVNQPPRPALTRCRRLITLRFRCLSPRYSWSLVLGYTGDVLTFEFLDPFAIKLTLLAVRYLQFPFFVSSSYSPSSIKLVVNFYENFKFRQISNFCFSHFPVHPVPHDASGFHCCFRFFFALLFFDSSPISEIKSFQFSLSCASLCHFETGILAPFRSSSKDSAHLFIGLPQLRPSS